MFSLNMQGKSNEIDIDFKHLFSQNFNFEKTKFNIILSQKLDQNYDFLNFFNTKTNLKIQNLIFEKNKQTISTQGDLSIDNNIYQANLQIITSEGI